MGFIIRVIIILSLIGYIAEGKYKEVPDPPKFNSHSEFVNKIHKEGLIGYTTYKKNKKLQENKK